MFPSAVPQNVAPLKLSEILPAFSLAIDLAENKPPGHARRVALLAVTLAVAAGLPRDEVVSLYYAGLLHDVGASSHDGSGSLPGLDEPAGGMKDWRRVMLHPEKGADIARQLPLSSRVAELILSHHEHLDGSGYPRGIGGELLDAGARILAISDAAEGVISSRYGAGEPWGSLGRLFRTQRGSVFDPGLADTLLSLLDASLLAEMETGAVGEALRRRVSINGDEIEGEKLERVLEALIRAIDLKSLSLGSHAANVARLAGTLAREAGFGEERQWEISMAGLFHDIGKFAVPTSILQKPLPLTESEAARVKSHPFYSGRVLREVEAFRDRVALWTELHHERSNGDGYPFNYTRQQIPLEARIIAAADILDALTSDRPYRRGVDGEEALRLLEKQAPAMLGREVAELLARARGRLLALLSSKKVARAGQGDGFG